LSPTFSIIVPTFNRADHLPVAIDSVIAQSRPDWELILVDDGSTDNTKEVIGHYSKEQRIRYHYQENRELNGARNTGTRLARGTYCCFLDDDDYYNINHLEALTQAISATGGSHGIYRTNMLILGEDMRLNSPPFINGEDALLQLWQTPRNLLPLAIHRDLLVSHPFDEKDLLIDDFVWLNTVLTQTTLFQAEAFTANYIQHKTNRTKLYHSIEILPKIVARLQHAYAVPGVKQRVDKALLHLRIHHQHMHLARQLSRQGERAKAFGVWRQGIRQGGIFPLKNTLKTLVKALLG